jgi:hypothetical protein
LHTEYPLAYVLVRSRTYAYWQRVLIQHTCGGSRPFASIANRPNFDAARLAFFLLEPLDRTKRQTILRLLAEEEAKLASLTNPPRQKASP